MEVDHHLIKDYHSSNKKPGGSGGSKLLYQATAGKDMTVRGLCDQSGAVWAAKCDTILSLCFRLEGGKKHIEQSCTRSASVQHGEAAKKERKKRKKN